MPVRLSISAFLMTVLIGLGAFVPVNGQRCLAGADRSFTIKDLQKQEARERQLATWLETQEDILRERSLVTIPVVVHVIWNKQVENISFDQILSQIDVLNRDFRAANEEIPGIPAVFQSVLADVEIEFCLATIDPSGNITNGVTRTYTDNSAGIGGTTNIHYTSMGGKNAWDPEHYLNIWVAKFAGGIGGTSSFPGNGPPAEDGIQIDYRQFGTINVEPPFHLGRTSTHEIGHYFNLEHIWGPSINSCCNDDDGVADTPNSCATYLNECPSHPVVSCSQPDMFMNFMNYTDDACMGMFTLGQKARMLAALQNLRPGLLQSVGCSLVDAEDRIVEDLLVVYRNPAREEVEFEIKSNSMNNWKAGLWDLTGRNISSSLVPANQVQQLELLDLPAGIYLLRCEGDGILLVQKIVVIKGI